MMKLNLALDDAQVLCPRSVAIARAENINVQVRSAFQTAVKGTVLVSKNDPRFAQAKLSAATNEEELLRRYK